MKPGIPQEVIDRVREAADIVEVIGRYVTLSQAGSTFKGLCPFHPEKTPSFTVNPERRTYKCFGCGEGGNVFSFLMKHGGLNFPEAVRELAQTYGVPMPREDLSPQEAQKLKAKDRMFKLMTAAADYFQSRLWSREGSLARAYLLERSIPKEVAKQFGLGWAEDRWDGLLNHFTRERVNPALLERAGLVSPPPVRFRTLRPVQGQADLSHPGPPGPGGGLWRPGGKIGSGAQVPQFAGNAAL